MDWKAGQMHLRRCAQLTGVFLLGAAAAAEPCTIMGRVSPQEIVEGAEAIVRATAIDYVVPPKDPQIRTTGVPDSTVRFAVTKVLKGRAVPAEIILPGYVTDRDDFNDHKPPYTFVRPGGRGSCIANAYRRNGEFLLMLKKDKQGAYTVNWYALGPVNEQLAGGDDPWEVWVRQQIDDAAELQQIEQRLARAWVEGDRDAIDAILDPNWTVTDIAGRVRTKLDVFRDMFAKQDRPIKAMTVDEVKVRLFGSIAVVTGRTSATGSDGTRVTLRFTDVFEKQDGRWQAVISQGTPIAK
jgi:ketosteroid isomerase-like protein